MSFAQLAANDNTSRLELLVNNFNNRLQLYESGKNSLEDPVARQKMKKYIKELDLLATHIKKLINDGDPDTPRFQQSFNESFQRYIDDKATVQSRITELDEAAAKKAREEFLAAPQSNALDQALIDPETEAIEFVNQQSTEILNDMKELKKATYEVHDKIVEQHEIILHVDETVAQAKEEMIQGNAELEIAEKAQKESSVFTSCKRLKKFLIITIIVVVLCVIAIGITYLATRK